MKRPVPGHKELQRETLAWKLQVEESLKRHEIQHFQGRYEQPGSHNSIRLLNWKVWSLRYGVSLNWIIDHLLQYYAKARRGSPNSLGISITTLTGEKAQQALMAMLAQEFSSKENLAVRRTALQIKMIQLPSRIQTKKEITVNQYIKEYRSKAMQLRHKFTSGQQKFRRSWRGNPWL